MDKVPSLVLASGSRTRAEILTHAGVPFEVCPARVDEEDIKRTLVGEGAPPREVADVLAEMKAVQVSTSLLASGDADSLVLGADQILVLDGHIFSKPADMDHARATLKLLRGKSHKLVSAACIARGGRTIWRSVDSASLTMRDFSNEFLDSYLGVVGKAALTSVGSYQIEGMGSQLFARVEGDHFTILGLPLLPLLDFLRQHKVVQP